MDFVGKFQKYPDLTGNRGAEGGRRLAGKIYESRPDAPLVTIITVCRNAASTIEQTISSVRRQTYKNIEYIVVDGRSTDRTLEIIRNNEDLIGYYVSEPDGGIYNAMNKGIELAQGSLILVLNSDDWYEDDAVSCLVAAHKYSRCSFVGGLARYINADGSSHVLSSMTFDPATLLRMPVRHQTMLISAALYNEIGPYDTDFSIIADFEFVIRLYQAGATYYELRKPILNFRTTGVSSTALLRLHNEHCRLLRKIFPFLSDEDVQKLGNHSTAHPDDFIAAANRHLDRPDFVLAVRAMLIDFKRLWGARWAEAKFDRLAAGAPRLFPKISVIVPFYNASSLVESAARMILAQDLKEIEVIFVNDRSTDDGAERLRTLASQDSRVRILHNDRNLGPAGSRNRGIKAARGRYIFFLDADDEVPGGTLRKLWEIAVAHDSVMVRGAFRVERKIHGQMTSTVKYPAGISNRMIVNTRLAEMPDLLATTEGHWAALYERNFVETVLYPESFRMGEDSVFLIRAMLTAERITIIPDIIYIYKDSPTSAMNNYDMDKYINDIAWRVMAWWMLKSFKFPEKADYFLFEYWSVPFFDHLDNTLSLDDRSRFYRSLFDAFEVAGDPEASRCRSPALREGFVRNFASFHLLPPPSPAPVSLEIAIITTSDHGGAGLSSLRCMEALRREGLSAFGICIFKKSNNVDMHVAPLAGSVAQAYLKPDIGGMWEAWFDAVALRRDGQIKTSARELFSTTACVINTTELIGALTNVDILHFHWVTGMIDYSRLGEFVGDRPLVWTLHDMNPFTGGCHYSEGCEGYRDQCRNCPLLEPGSTLAHDAWRTKRDAYSKIKNLRVVCPSQWMADCARHSSLLGDREIHVIPNALPVEHFALTNKAIARIKLGIPLDKKYIAFGADNLNNERKGGKYLRESIEKLKAKGLTEGVEGLFFGWSDLKVDMKCRNMGYISDPKKLALIYSAADVFAFPSLEDNAPQTVPEALLSGTPVVSFPIGNVKELINHMDTGFIARFQDSDSFAEGLAWALQSPRSPEALMRGINAHLNARAYHEPQITVDMLKGLYADVAGSAQVRAQRAPKRRRPDVITHALSRVGH